MKVNFVLNRKTLARPRGRNKVLETQSCNTHGYLVSDRFSFPGSSVLSFNNRGQ